MVAPAVVHCKQYLKPWKNAGHCHIYPVGSALALRRIHYVRSKHLLKPMLICLGVTERYSWCRDNLTGIKAAWELTVWDENQILLQVQAGVWRRPGANPPPVIKHP